MALHLYRDHHSGAGIFCNHHFNAHCRSLNRGPYRYTRLIFSTLLAMAFLGERPDLLTWVGSAIVIASGLIHSGANGCVRAVKFPKVTCLRNR